MKDDAPEPPPKSPAIEAMIAEYNASEVEAAAAAGGHEEDDTLRAYGSGAIFSGVSDMTREEIDAKIAASEARTETGLERAIGEVRAEFTALRGDIRELKASSAGKGTVIITGVTSVITILLGLASLLYAMLAYGGDRFDSGRELGGQLAEVNAKLDKLTLQAAPISTAPPTGAGPVLGTSPAPKSALPAPEARDGT